MTDAPPRVGEDLAGLHLSFIGFVVLWFNQHELGVSAVGVVEIVGWTLVLAGGALTFSWYVSE